VQIDLLKTNQTALRILLDRIAAQEAETRAVINSLPDFICVITVNGKILQTNSAFDDEFPFTQQEMEKGVHIWNIFTELASDFYRTIDEEEVATQASRRFGDVIDVSVRVRSLKEANEASSTQSQEKVTGLTSLNLQDAEEAYVVIAKNRSIKAVEVISEDRVRRSAFEKRFRDKGFQTDFKQFCEKNKTVENIMFLEAVAEYKKKSFGDRVDMKMHIFDQFIKEEARMQLNLDNATVVEETIKIGKSMGDIDVFKTVEDCVYKIIVNDIMPRYILEKQII
jgi:PAS domain S-box-containing protein